MVNIVKNKVSKKINLGVVLDFSGEASQDALGIREGINLALRDLNREGYKVYAEYLDDKSNVEMSAGAVLEFIKKYNIDALIGPTWSYQVGSIAPLVEQEQLPTFAPAVASDCINTKSNFLLFGAEKNTYKETPINAFIKKNKIKRVSLIISQDGWGVSHIAPVQQAIQKSSAKLVYVEQLLPYISSFGDQAVQDALSNSVKNNADLIIWAGYEFEANSLAKILIKNKFRTPIIGDQLLVFGERYNLLKKYKGDIFIFNNKFSNAFEKLFKECYQKLPTLYSDVAYDGTKILVENIEKGLYDEKLIQYIKSKKFSYKGYAGNYRFDNNGDVNLGGRWEIKKVY